jgi:hypothetical protein
MGRLALGTLALAAPLLLGAAPAAAAGGPPPAERYSQTQIETSYGCAILGGAAAALALTIGPGSILGVVTGSAAGGSPLAAAGLTGITFGSFCLVGQAATPMALDLADRLEEPAARLAADTRAFIADAIEQAPTWPDRLQAGAVAAWEGVGEGVQAAREFVWVRFLRPAEQLGTRTTATAISFCDAHPSCGWAVRQYRGAAAWIRPPGGTTATAPVLPPRATN